MADPEVALAPLRRQIDTIDDRLVELLAARMSCVRQVIEIKQENGIPARISARVEEVVARVRMQAERVGAPPDLAEIVWREMIEWVIGFEETSLGGHGG